MNLQHPVHKLIQIPIKCSQLEQAYYPHDPYFGLPSILSWIDLLDILNDDRRVREIRERLHAVSLGKYVGQLALRFDDVALGVV